MKVGMIGIGDIAQKAYLPVLSHYTDIDIHLCTRNQETLEQVASTYKIKHTYDSIDELLESDIEAAFVHSSTESHEEIVDQLLEHNIHVFVDKPISYDFDSSKRLVEKAKEKGLILMVGFNRRFAPPYEPLKELVDPNMIIVEKHRAHHPDDARIFVFDDFIHVIDTLLNLYPYDIENFNVQGKIVDGQLYYVILQLQSKQGTAIGIMNRDSGINEEIVKVFSPEETRVVRNINEATFYKGRQSIVQGTDDWEPTLHKRGFYHMTRKFIDAVRDKTMSHWDYEQDLKRHEIAERIVQKLNEMKE